MPSSTAVLSSSCSSSSYGHHDGHDDHDSLMSKRLIYFSPDDVLTLIGLHRHQVLMILICGFAYASYNIQLLLQALITTSMWEEWPHLESSLGYNWIFFATGCCKLIGALILVPLQDIFGRRRTLITSLVFFALVSGLGAAMPNFPSYCVMRCLVYLVSACINCSLYVYQIEMVPIRSRTLPPTITQLFGTTGIVFITMVWWLLGKYQRAWRWITLLSVAPSLLALFLLAFFPFETPRFYCATGREKAAWDVFIGLTPGGADGLTQLLGEGPETRALILHHRDCPNNQTLDHPDNTQHKVSCVGLVSRVSREMVYGLKRIGTLCVSSHSAGVIWTVCILWGLQAFAYWGVTSYLPSFFESIGLDAHAATLYTFLFEYPGMILAYFLMKSTHCLGGRVSTLRIYTIGCAAVLAIFAICTQYLPHGHGFLYVPTMLTYFFAAPIWTVLYTYTPELFPTDCRGTAMSVAGLANGFPTLVTFFLGSQTVGSWLYPAIWSAVYGLLSLTALFAVSRETVAEPLEDVLQHTKGGSSSIAETHHSLELYSSQES